MSTTNGISQESHLTFSSGPKSAAAKPKATATNAKTPATGAAPAGAKGRGGRRRGQGRPPKKTAEQLDADMADYFDATGAATNGAAAAATTNGAPAAAPAGGEVPMEDEIM